MSFALRQGAYLAGVFLVLCMAAFPTRLSAQVPRQMSVQGIVTDAAGTPVSDGSYNVKFALFPTPTAGSAVWVETTNISTRDGLYNAILGKINPLPGAAFYQALYLELTFNGSIMMPRTPLTSTPYALGLNLPFVGTATDGSDAFTLTNTASTGKVAHLENLKPNNPGTVLHVETKGIGYGGYFKINQGFNSQEAVYAETNGYGEAVFGHHIGPSGRAGYFRLFEATASNDSPALESETNGGGEAVYGHTSGSGPAGRFVVENNSNSSPALQGESNSSGIAVHGLNTGDGVAVLGSSGNGEAVEGISNGSGNAIRGIALDTGYAGFLQILNAQSNKEVLRLHNTGDGPFLNALDSENSLFRVENDGRVRVFQNGTAVITLDPDFGGEGRVITEELEITGGADLSEHFALTVPDVEPGMVVTIDPDTPGHLTLSHQAYDRKVAGIVSGAGGIETGLVMGQRGSVADGTHPVALTGRVYVYADATDHPIAPGDLLTTSHIPGHAMKVMDYPKAQGAILGKAMTGLETGQGLVLVLVALQ